MVLVKELFQDVDKDAVVAEIKRIHSDMTEQMKSEYEKAISRIERAEDRPNEEERTIHVEYTKDFGETNTDYIWHTTYSLNKRFHHQYSLRYISVEEIATAFVREEDLEEISREEYFAHLLYEIVHRDITEPVDNYISVEKGERKQIEAHEAVGV